LANYQQYFIDYWVAAVCSAPELRLGKVLLKLPAQDSHHRVDQPWNIGGIRLIGGLPTQFSKSLAGDWTDGNSRNPSQRP
jgi:hypothetical protein